MIDTMCVILCGGRGTRLAPVIGENIPKCLAPVCGKPWIYWLLKHTTDCFFAKTVLAGGPYAQQFHDELSTLGFNMLEHDSAVGIGTAGSVASAWDNHGDISIKDVVVLNGDTIATGSIDLLMYIHRVNRSDISSMIFGDYGYGLDYCGVFVMSRRAINNLPIVNLSIDKDILKNTRRHSAMWTKSPYLDIGTPEGYAKAPAFLKEYGIAP